MSGTKHMVMIWEIWQHWLSFWHFFHDAVVSHFNIVNIPENIHNRYPIDTEYLTPGAHFTNDFSIVVYIW